MLKVILKLDYPLLKYEGGKGQIAALSPRKKLPSKHPALLGLSIP